MTLHIESIKTLGSVTGIRIPRLYDYMATRVRPGRQRALYLENVCREIGLDIPAMVWLYGAPDEIRRRLSNGNGNG